MGGFWKMKTSLSIVTLIIVAILIYFFYDHITYDFDTPKGILHEKIRSPEGNYSARIYYEYYGGAAGGVNVYVTIVDKMQDNIEKQFTLVMPSPDLELAG